MEYTGNTSPIPPATSSRRTRDSALDLQDPIPGKSSLMFPPMSKSMILLLQRQETHPKCPNHPGKVHDNHQGTGIKNVHPQSNELWTLHARVITRNPPCHYKSWRSRGGRLMGIFLGDDTGGHIKATLFSVAIDHFQTMDLPGSTCEFSGGRTKCTNRAFVISREQIEL
ncbi:unnamed protein product [Phytophthora fragariaefolia]|uniref:Unnamed protein product n=1 Tax=Phytophthora fragariaefolia TaxID=1490495 RepID=A0A9W7CRQ8_9STRA|nr:unnamed protein product [Phytophthora fragariaefolia]